MARKHTVLAVALACALFARPAFATSILVNGGFETGDLSGWTLKLACGSCHGVAVSSLKPYEGVYDVSFGGPSIGAGYQDQLSQSVATTPGESYLLHFWMMQDSPPCATSGSIEDRFRCTNNNFSILWNGERAMFRQVIQPGSYLEYQVSVLAAGPVSTLTIDAANDPGHSRFDNISLTVNANAPIEGVEAPEPASFLLVAVGLIVVVRGLSTSRRQQMR